MATMAEWKKEQEKRPSLQTGHNIRARVRDTGKAEAFCAAQGRDGDCLILTLWYTMGTREGGRKEGWSRVFGIAATRQLPGDELYRGVVVCPSLFQAEQAVWALHDAGWTIRGRSWVKPSATPFTPDSTAAERAEHTPPVEVVWTRWQALPAEQRGDVEPLSPTVLTPFLRPVQSSTSGTAALGPTPTLNQGHTAPSPCGTTLET